ncbi:unnamed protein product [Acanthosepion pharaonis]|uniref:Uncharacterized protein n=1 Tax=Acanthosepion pharaonis TaxID=158019 RepID=A0A812E4K2_ACAPH|nr:unnamed protein product [Sepia pharaonis]
MSSSKRHSQRFESLPSSSADSNDCPPELTLSHHQPRHHHYQQQQQQQQQPQRSSTGDADIVLVDSIGRMRGSNGLLYAGATGTTSVPGSGRREKSGRSPAGSKPSHRHGSHHSKNSSMLPPPPDPPVLDTSDLSTSSDSIGNGGYSSFLGSTNNGHYQRVPQPCPDPDPIGTVGMGDITGSPDYLDSNDNQQFVDHTSSCSPVNSDSWGDPSKILDSLQAETTTGDDTASSTSESDVTQM